MKGLMALIIGISLGTTALAEPITPARGTELRSTLMDTLRVFAIDELDAPIEFVVGSLRVDGDRAFASVSAQRPGGAPIDMLKTPFVQRNGADPNFNLSPDIQAFLHRKSGVWTITDIAVSPNDVWWYDPQFCTHFASVLPDQVC